MNTTELCLCHQCRSQIFPIELGIAEITEKQILLQEEIKFNITLKTSLSTQQDNCEGEKNRNFPINLILKSKLLTKIKNVYFNLFVFLAWEIENVSC